MVYISGAEALLQKSQIQAISGGLVETGSSCTVAGTVSGASASGLEALVEGAALGPNISQSAIILDSS